MQIQNAVNDDDLAVLETERPPCNVRIRHPEAHVQLFSYEGKTAMVCAGRAATALKHAGVNGAEIQEFLLRATAGDLNNLLGVLATWVTID